MAGDTAGRVKDVLKGITFILDKTIPDPFKDPLTGIFEIASTIAEMAEVCANHAQ